MKNIIHQLMLLAGVVLITTSCEEKINLKINNGEPQVVIEGNLSDQPGPYYVLVTKSKLFDDNNNIQGLPGAVVVISDDAGNSDTLSEPLAGLYLTNTIQGVVGRNYHIQVTVEGTTYEMFSKMQPPVDIDSIVVFEETEFDGKTKKKADILVRDPGGVSNFYRVVSYKGGDQSSGFDVHRDRLWDGKLRNFNVPHSDFASGDTVKVELWSIDERAYTYFDQFNENQNNFGSPAAPANPDPVFTPACLGYFSAHSVKSKTIIIP